MTPDSMRRSSAETKAVDSEGKPLPLLDKPRFDRTPKYKPQPKKGVALRRLIEGKTKDHSSRVFDVVLSNDSSIQVMLTHFEVRWRYVPGVTASIVEGALLVPLTQYIIDLDVDVYDHCTREKSEVVYPPILLPPRNGSGPSLTTFRLQVHYSLLGQARHHPSTGWNIIFSVSVATSHGVRLDIIPEQEWRC